MSALRTLIVGFGGIARGLAADAKMAHWFPVATHAQALRALVGPEEDPELLAVARRCASRRVVVKRRPHAPPLGGKPDQVVAGSRVRYHVYFTAPG